MPALQHTLAPQQLISSLNHSLEARCLGARNGPAAAMEVSHCRERMTRNQLPLRHLCLHLHLHCYRHCHAREEDAACVSDCSALGDSADVHYSTLATEEQAVRETECRLNVPTRYCHCHLAHRGRGETEDSTKDPTTEVRPEL